MLAAVALAFNGSLHAQLTPTANVRLRVDPQTVVVAIPDDFLGFGYETSAAAPRDFFNAKNAAMVQLYRTLSSHGVVRIGGNVSDHARYEPNGTPAARPQEQTTVINRADLDALGGFLRATGWKAIWGLNLGTGTKEEAATEAAAVDAALGDRLRSFEIGNEVDLLPRFARNYDAYHAAYTEYKAAIRAVLPRAAFSGPDAAWATRWCVDFAADEGLGLHALTQHYYRTGAGKPDATMENLLRRDDYLFNALATLRQAVRGRGITSRICEVNSFYGGGKPGVSDTFGSALWCLDFLFTLAGEGCGGVNLETDVNQHGWVSHYSPIFRDPDGTLHARPEYYAMLAFSRAGTGELVKLERDGGAGINLTAFATRQGADSVWVTVINKDLTTDAAVTLAVPGAWASGSVYPLRAPTVESKEEVTLAGVEVTADGIWGLSKQPTVDPSPDGQWRLNVPHASALLLQLRR